MGLESSTSNHGSFSQENYRHFQLNMKTVLCLMDQIKIEQQISTNTLISYFKLQQFCFGDYIVLMLIGISFVLGRWNCNLDPFISIGLSPFPVTVANEGL